MLGMTKPALALVSLLTMGTVGAGLWGWFTIPGLYDQIEELERQVDRLAGEVDRFEILNNQLNQTVGELQVINQELNHTATRLETSVDELERENDRLETLNNNLEDIVGFLNETTAEIGETLDDVTAYLAEQITVNRVIVLETLENTYQQDMQNWDCAFRDIFRDRHFVADENIPIGMSDIPAVLDYVEDRVRLVFVFALLLQWQHGVCLLALSHPFPAILLTPLFYYCTRYHRSWPKYVPIVPILPITLKIDTAWPFVPPINCIRAWPCTRAPCLIITFPTRACKMVD